MARPRIVPSWLDRMPGDLADRLERAEARAREQLIDVHAELALDLVGILAPRMPFDQAISRYLETMSLEGEEAEAVGTRAVALMDEREVTEDLAREGHRGWGWDWRYATPLGLLRFIERHQKRSDEEELWLELASARAEERLAEAHRGFAMEFVRLMEEAEHADPARAVALYVERLDLPERRGWIVYQRTLAHIADQHLPRLDEEEPAPGDGAAG